MDRGSQHIPIVVLLTTYFSTMSKEDESPWLTLMKDMKNELIKQMQSSEASIKEQLRASNEETNAKITSLSNNVKENSSKISNIEQRISKLESPTATTKPTYTAVAGRCDNISESNNTATNHTDTNHEIHDILTKAS